MVTAFFRMITSRLLICARDTAPGLPTRKNVLVFG